jgi:hypothetical protein
MDTLDFFVVIIAKNTMSKWSNEKKKARDAAKYITMVKGQQSLMELVIGPPTPITTFSNLLCLTRGPRKERGLGTEWSIPGPECSGLIWKLSRRKRSSL